jgi:hypothetical protein
MRELTEHLVTVHRLTDLACVGDTTGFHPERPLPGFPGSPARWPAASIRCRAC